MRIKGGDGIMRYLTTLFLIIGIFFSLGITLPVEAIDGLSEHNVNWNSNVIMKIAISVNIKPIKDSEYCYEYSTAASGEVIYITHLLNSFDLIDDGKAINGGDIPIINIDIIMQNKSVQRIGFIGGRFFDTSNKQYAVDQNEYDYFLDFIYALKMNRIDLSDEVTSDSSEWAKADIKKAIEFGLVPERNQINYKGNITRLEACQLVANLLKDSNHINDNMGKNPFSDTRDKSIVALYHLKILNGKSQTHFYPYDLITREEFAKILSNTYYFIKNEITLDDDGFSYNDQNQISDWAVESVNAMTGLGMFKGNENGEFEPLKNITKEEVIVTLLRLSNVIN